MLLKTAFLHMERTEALELFANKKIGGKIDRLTNGPTAADLTFLVEKGDQIVKLRLKPKQGKIITLQAITEDMYTSVNKLAGQLDEFLKRRKGRKLKGRHKHLPQQFELLEEEATA